MSKIIPVINIQLQYLLNYKGMIVNILQVPSDHEGPLFATAIINKESNVYDEKVLGFKVCLWLNDFIPFEM